MKNYLELLRVNHWVKNTFIFAPLFFSGQITEPEKLFSALIAFLAMCLAASAVYILNDLIDAENDRLHPVKQQRPIANKTVSESRAKVLMLLFAALGLSFAFYLSLISGIFLGAYILINILYSYRLKHVPIIDIILIASGFLLRVLLGSEATAISPSHWLVSMTFVLALFLALGKRHDDLLIMKRTGTQLRRSLDGYNLKFTTHGMTLLAGTLFLMYFQYLHAVPVSIRLQNKAAYVSSIFVLIGMMRYLQTTFVHEKSCSPVTQLLTDRFLQVIVLGWLCHFIFMLYL